MTYRGKIHNGVVVLERGAELAEGTEVQVQATDVPTEQELQSLRAMLLKYAGTVKNMPSDFARNHDHYIHGAPKK